MDGSGNNLIHPDWGQAGTLLRRGSSGAWYSDGIGAMLDRGNPRAISNALATQTRPVGNAAGLSSMFWQWGQFIDHDFALVAENHAEPYAIPVPAGDPHFDPMGTGTVTLPFFRNHYTEGVTSPRQQANTLTHWIDGSQVYGSDTARAHALRAFTGGRMLMGPDGMLPRNTMGLPNFGGDGDPSLFAAGDIRANEQIGLLSMHTVFVREHNHWADRLASENPTWTDEQIYHQARRIVGAEIQAITYNQWLPALLGGHGPGSYAGYDPSVEPNLDNAFSGAAFRIGHTLLNNTLLRLNEDGSEFAGGHVPLAGAFLRPDLVEQPGSLDAIVRGLAAQQANEIDTQVVDAVRNMLLGAPGAGGMDLITLNLQRGRDHGLPDYNTLREEYGLARVDSFDDITSDPALQAALMSVYTSVDGIDPWIGLMAEDHLVGASVGETIAAIFRDQFSRLRDGDRFFYLNDPGLSPELVAEIEGTLLSDILLRTTGIDHLQPMVFIVPAPAAGALAAIGLAGALARRRRA